jgi:hypothetical protein
MLDVAQAAAKQILNAQASNRPQGAAIDAAHLGVLRHKRRRSLKASANGLNKGGPRCCVHRKFSKSQYNLLRHL